MKKDKKEKFLYKLEKGVTENAPYEDIAEYRMITVESDDDTINTQGS